MIIKFDTTKLSDMAIECLYNEGETYDGLTYLGITPSDDTWELAVDDLGPITVPAFLMVDTNLLTKERIAVIDRLEDDLDHPATNDYYNYMLAKDPNNLSGDDSYFDYGNSFVTIIADEVLSCIS